MKRTRTRHGGHALPDDGWIIGVDIGATAVRGAVLARGGGVGALPSVVLQTLGHVDLPLGAVVDGVVKDGPAVTSAVRHLAHATGFSSRHVVLGTANQQVVVRDLRMPNLPPEQLRVALPFQARELVALPMDEALLDFIPLGEVDTATNTVSGLLVAAPRLPVLAAVHAVERAGLTVAKVDLSSLAALRFLAQEGLPAEAIVDLGAHLTSIVIHGGGVPKVVRTVAHGGQELTDRLADRADLSLADAELVKCNEGMTGEGDIPTILSEGIRPLLAEIRSSLHFFASTNPDTPLGRVSLTGGAAALPGLAALLASQHGITVEVVPPYQHIETRWSTHMRQTGSGVSASAVSVGLAMGAVA